MVVIRLSRSGAKKNPYYFITVADSRNARDGAFIERLGFYNPSAQGQEETLRIDIEKVDEWVSKGAQISDRVKRLIKDSKLSPEELDARKAAKKDKADAKKAAALAAKQEEIKKQAEEAEEEAPAEEAAPEEATVEEAPLEEAPLEEAPAEEAAPEEEAPVEEAPAEEAAPEEEAPVEEASAEEAAPEEEAPVEEAPVEEAPAEEAAPEEEAPEEEAAPVISDVEKSPASIVSDFEKSQLKENVPSFRPGDTVSVSVKVKDGQRTRLQAFEGVVMSVRNSGLNSSFIVRKISSGIGVERTFQLHSPLIDSISVKRKGDVRKAKLFYLRERSGKSARIKERLD